MTDIRQSRLCIASSGMGVAALVLALALVVPEAAGVRWVDVTHGAVLDLLGVGLILSDVLALGALAVGIIGLARKWDSRRFAAIGTILGGAVLILAALVGVFFAA